MDLDAFVAAHTREWQRLEQLVGRARRPRRCTGTELDELVDLYQRTATHLSVVRSASPDPHLVGRLTSLVARARGAVTGSRTTALDDVTRFAAVSFPAAVYRARWWVIGTAALFVLVAFATGTWVATHPEVQRSIAAPENVRQLVEQDFEDYYSSAPAASFSARVFTNNAQVGAVAIFSGVLLGVFPVFVLVQNALNVGVTGGLMAANGRADLFFGLILPHGLLELTAVFVAAGVGMRLGWTVVDPGARRRSDALAEEGRSAVAVVLGLVVVFFASGLIEAFVTPSGLPTAARIGIGIAALAGFTAYIGLLGRRAAAAGETGDLDASRAGDRAPTV